MPIAILVILALLSSAVAHYGYYGVRKVFPIETSNGHNSASGCQDDSNYCRYWVWNVGCTHPDIKKNCRLSCNACQGSKWKYGETESSVYGPKDWGQVSRYCTESAQSPINIDTINPNHYRYHSFLRGFSADAGIIGAQLVNNGHAPTLKVYSGTAFLAGGPWGNDRYKLEQFHFHFGCTARTGSEHRVNGFQYSGELHLVFYNTKYKDFKSAADKTDGLTVIGVFLQETNSQRNNCELLKLSDKLTKVTEADDDVKIWIYIYLDTLVPALASMSRTSFFSYKGSLTTPPCYQSVNWIVLYQPIPASTKVMNAFRLLKNKEGRPMCNNYRPVQPLNDRMVTRYGTRR